MHHIYMICLWPFSHPISYRKYVAPITFERCILAVNWISLTPVSMLPFNLLSNNLLDHAFLSPVGKYFYIHSQHCFHITNLSGNAWLETMVSAQYWFYSKMSCAARHAAFTCWVGDLCTSHYCNLAQAHHNSVCCWEKGVLIKVPMASAVNEIS